MITFEYPELLWLLLLLPLVALIFLWARTSRSRRLKRFGNPQTLAALMPDASRYMPWVKLTLQLTAIAILVLMVARPRMEIPQTQGQPTETTVSRGIEVMVCVDVSNSMLASSTDDSKGISRLQRARHILEKLIDRMSNDKVGLIVFAGDAYTQLPITSDYVSAKMFLQNLNTEMVPTQGTAIGAAIQMAMNSFTPDDTMPRAIIILTDGENFEDNPIEAARRASDAGIQVDVIGLGTPNGAKIPLKKNPQTTSDWMTDSQGNTVVTHLDETTALQIAQAGKGIYVNGASSSAISDIDKTLRTLGSAEFERKTYSPQSEQFPLLAWLALILLIANALTVTRKIGWLRKYQFFSRSNTPSNPKS